MDQLSVSVVPYSLPGLSFVVRYFLLSFIIHGSLLIVYPCCFLKVRRRLSAIAVVEGGMVSSVMSKGAFAAEGFLLEWVGRYLRST